VKIHVLLPHWWLATFLWLEVSANKSIQWIETLNVSRPETQRNYSSSIRINQRLITSGNGIYLSFLWTQSLFYVRNLNVWYVLNNSEFPHKSTLQIEENSKMILWVPTFGGEICFWSSGQPFFLRNYEFQKSPKKNLKYEGPETVGRIRDHLEGKAQKTIFFMKLLVLPWRTSFSQEKKGNLFSLSFLFFRNCSHPFWIQIITFRNVLGSKETASTDVILSFKGEEVLNFVGKHFEINQLEILYL